jgi:hypothetical protein
MTPEDKAQQLIFAFEAFTDRDNELEFAKQCALIAVDEIMNAIDWHDYDSPNEEWGYWEEVKQEIEKL